MNLGDRLRRGERIILDGGMAAEVQRRGAPLHPIAWSARPLVTHAPAVRAVHEDYIRAGADVITTNTFSTTPHVLRRDELAHRARELTVRAVALAREARDAAAPGGDVAIAGSVSASMGRSGAPAPPANELEASYRQHVELLTAGGVDLLLLEMMVDPEVTRIALEAAHTTGLPVWLGCSCAVVGDRAPGEVRMFGRGDRPRFDDLLEAALPLGVDALLVMHTEVDDVAPALAVARRHWRGPFGAYAHRGRYGDPTWHFDDAIAPADYADVAAGWADAGAQIVGGCCGIGPEHVRVLAERLRPAAP